MVKPSTKKITKTVVDALKVPEGRDRVKVFDSKITGFGVMRTTTGATSFFYYYGPPQRRKYHTLGTYGRLTVPQARVKAREAEVMVGKGQDPQAMKREGRKAQAQTFKLWVEEYLKLIEVKKATWKTDRRFLLWATHRIGTMPLSEITSGDVERLTQLVRAEGLGASARWKGKPTTRNTTSNRFLASVRACLSHALKRGLIPSNPALRTWHPPENDPRQRVLSDDELVKVLEAVAAVVDPFARAAFTLLLETGARTSEVLRARWDDMDLDGRLWRLPRPKARKPQVIPLADSTVAMLRRLPRVEESPWVIPGHKEGAHRVTLKTAWQEVQKAAKIPDVHLHDIRRTFGLHVSRTSGVHVASLLLRHSSVAITAKIYAPLGLEELTRAMNKVSKERGKLLKFAKEAEK